MKKLLIGLTLLLSLPGFSASKKEVLLGEYDAEAQKGESIILNEIEKSNLDESQAEEILADYEASVSKTREEIESLSDEDVSQIKEKTKPLSCYYNYTSHVNSTVFGINEIKKSASSNKKILMKTLETSYQTILLPLFVAMDLILTPVSLYYAVVHSDTHEPTSDMRREECY